MRLRATMYEDARGRRSVNVVLYLHGLVDVHDVQELQRIPARRVDIEKPSRGAYRDIAELELLAGDNVNVDDFGSMITDGMHEALFESEGDWVSLIGAEASFSVEEHVTGDKSSILNSLISAAMLRLRRRSKHSWLRVQRLELTDYRGIDDMSLDFPPKTSTVLVGANGCGKTTLLDAIALLLSHLEKGITRSSRGARMFTDMDIMNGRNLARASISAELTGIEVDWSLSHVRGEEVSPAKAREDIFSLYTEIDRIRRDIEQGDVSLPIIVFYPVNRAVLDIPLRTRTQHVFEPIEAYDGALMGDRRNFRLFFEWFRGREDLENEIRIHDSAHRDSQLEAVRNAISSLMPEFVNLRVQRSPLGMVVNKGEWTLFVDQLSDGEKCLLAMTGDLARRLAMANPYMDNPLLGGGVILIDEIELHLHPSWQRRVIPALERTFPNCQFIVTTHSPAVVGHVQRESLFLLKPGTSGIRAEMPNVSLGLDVNRVLLEIMGVDERPHEIKARLELIFTLIGEGKLEDARKEIEALEAKIGADPELTKASTIIRRKEVLGR